jgi:hypothetical protein
LGAAIIKSHTTKAHCRTILRVQHKNAYLRQHFSCGPKKTQMRAIKIKRLQAVFYKKQKNDTFVARINRRAERYPEVKLFSAKTI